MKAGLREKELAKYCRTQLGAADKFVRRNRQWEPSFKYYE
jgi:hypothetical protein